MFSHSGSTLMIVGGSIPRGVLENRRLFLYVCCEPLVGVPRADHHGGRRCSRAMVCELFSKGGSNPRFPTNLRSDAQQCL